MCCLDLKYAKKLHGHNYAKQSDIDDAAATLQAALDALAGQHAGDVATLQAALDALAGQHAGDVATLQAALDALAGQHAGDVATLQAAFDAELDDRDKIYNNRITDLTLQSGWISFDGSPIREIWHRGIIYLQGSITGGPDNALIVRVENPPPRTLRFSCATNNSGNPRIAVGPGGGMYIYGSLSNGWTSLDGIAWPTPEHFYAPG